MTAAGGTACFYYTKRDWREAADDFVRLDWERFGERWPQEFWSALGPSGGAWQLFATFTARADILVSPFHNLVRMCVKQAAVHLNDHLLFFGVFAPQPGTGRPHCHALLSPRPGAQLPPDVLARTWRTCGYAAGDCKVEAFDPKRDGVAYLVEHGPPLLKVACPRTRGCRGKPCRLDPLGWRREGD